MPLTPEQQAEVYRALQEKYDNQVDSAQSQADSTTKVAMIGSALEGLARAGGRNQVDQGFYNQISQNAQGRVADAKDQRKQAIASYLQQKKGEADQANADRKYNADEAWRVKEDEWRRKQFEDKAAKDERDFGQKERLIAATLADRQATRAEQAEAKAAEKAEKADLLRNELEVPGYGQARSKGEAGDLRSAVVDTKSAIDDLNAVKALGTDVSIMDRGRVAKIDQLLNSAVGKLRLSMTGPGSMTEAERQMIRQSIGDPTALFSTEEIQKGKLDQLIQNLEKRLKDEMSQKVIPAAGAAPSAKSAQFPMTVTDANGRTATVSNADELAEAQAEGFK